MALRLEASRFGFDYLVVDTETGEATLIQSDWDYPGVARLFGWTPCPQCNLTDGTIDCAHYTAREMIASAWQFLDDHLGEEADL